MSDALLTLYLAGGVTVALLVVLAVLTMTARAAKPAPPPTPTPAPQPAPAAPVQPTPAQPVARPVTSLPMRHTAAARYGAATQPVPARMDPDADWRGKHHRPADDQQRSQLLPVCSTQAFPGYRPRKKQETS